jgi:hypothetical protein
MIRIHTWKSFNDIFSTSNAHNRHTWHFTNPPLEVSVVCCNNVDLVPHHSIHDTVIGVGALVAAFESLPSLVSGNAKRDSVLLSQLFEFGHDTICDDRDTFGVETVHHGGKQFEFLLHRVGEEVGVDEDIVWRNKGGVVLKEQGGRDLWTVIVST